MKIDPKAIAASFKKRVFGAPVATGKPANWGPAKLERTAFETTSHSNPGGGFDDMVARKLDNTLATGVPASDKELLDMWRQYNTAYPGRKTAVQAPVHTPVQPYRVTKGWAARHS